jgi:3-oxoacyl-[acyl-carrier protein] reductase
VQGASGSRRVLVLGASSDIGVALVERFLVADYEVIAHHHANSEAFDGLRSNGHNFDDLQLDLSDLGAVEQAAGQDAVTSCDAVVFLASIAKPSSLERIDPAELEVALRVGAISNFLFMSTMGPAMAARGWGRIVIGSSIGVKFGGGKDSFGYALAQHASEFIPRSARDWASSGVLTNVVRIGVTDTKLHGGFPGRDKEQRARLIPMKRAALPEEIADYLFWMGSEQNSFVTGQVSAISGGE